MTNATTRTCITCAATSEAHMHGVRGHTPRMQRANRIVECRRSGAQLASLIRTCARRLIAADRGSAGCSRRHLALTLIG